MASQSTEPDATPWPHRLRALVGGHAVASAAFLLIAVVQPAGLDPPPESVALFVVATTAGVISHQLLADDLAVGAVAAILTGLYTLVVVGVVAGGVYGSFGTQTNPIGPIAYVLLTVAVIVAGGQVWRTRPSTAGPEAL